MRLLTIILFAMIVCGCSLHNKDHSLEAALMIAGDNRPELEKVLLHYSEDNEKLAAAKFIITNMPEHYSYSDTTLMALYHQATDSFICTNPDISIFNLCDSIDSIANRMGVNSTPIVSDCRLISADYLIRNIDQAFYQWRSGKWLRHLNFEQFCEYILPYKVKDLQPLDDWRTRFCNVYASELEVLEYCDLYNGSPFQACRRINEAYRRDLHPGPTNEKKVNIHDISVRLKVPHGMCSDFVYLTAVIFRSVGLPIARDCTPHWGDQRLGHSWNALLACNGKHVPFTGMMGKIEDGLIIDERLPKVFRSTYAANPSLVNLNRSERHVPAFFKNIFQKDVTDEYTLTSSVVVNCRGIENHAIYLCVYGDNDWTPIDYANIEDGKAIFKSLGRNILYLPVYINTVGEKKAIADPFILGFDGLPVNIKPSTKTITATLDRKYPVLKYVWDYARLIKNGRFEASDDSLFHHNVYKIHTIMSGRAVGGDIPVSDTIPACRYWRYINTDPETYGSMAEISFYDSASKFPLRGEIIGSKGCWENNPTWRRENLFDGNTLTSYCAPSGTGCWVGLDFGQSVKISRIRYTPRGDGNMIEPGDIYELFYWSDGKWVSLGTKKAETVSVTYENIPEGGLLLLRDNTKGHDERIFMINNNGQQEWW